ncbi:MAG: cupin domain-containing protein [Gaiellaceae bacterium]
MIDPSEYFAASPAGQPTSEGSFVALDGVSPVEFLAGLEMRPIVTDRMLVNFVSYEPNTVVPEHSHGEEQITFVLEGEFEFWIGDDKRILRPGTVAVIPSWVPHGARTYDSHCRQVDVFCPPRQVLLEALKKAGRA